MLQISAIISGFILTFVLVSGLVVLFLRGADDLDSWGLFVARVLRGDSRAMKLPCDRPEELEMNPELPKPVQSAGGDETGTR
jgi:hypothetical protein